MKKIISLILAGIICFAFSVMVFAAPESTTAAPATSAPATTTTTAVAVDESVIEEVFKQFATMIDAESEARYTVASDAMFNLYSVIKENNIKDYVALSSQLKKYAEDNESELAPVFDDLFSVQIILKKFTIDGTFDLNKVQKEIEGSNSLDLLLTLYTGAYIVRTTQSVSVKEGETTMVENPKTGDSGIDTGIACAVLGLGVATILVCTKKKEA